jgi:hypothetical protein
LKRSGQGRARLSENTIRVLSKRRTLRDAFKERLRAELDDIGLRLVQLERGSFGIIPINALDGAVASGARCDAVGNPAGSNARAASAAGSRVSAMR